jgi:hypothetical protein
MPCRRFSMRIAAFQLLRIWKGNQGGADDRQACGHVEIGLRFEGSKRDALRYCPAGFLTYTEEGRVTSLIAMAGERYSPPVRHRKNRRRLLIRFLYALSGDKVTHHIEISSIQNYVGKDLVR